MLQKYLAHLSSHQIKFLAALGAASLYSSWVFFNNYGESLINIISSVSFQWILSFFSTLFFSQVILWFINGSKKKVRIFLSAATASMIYMIILWGGHFFAGTHNMALSLLPISIVATLYAFFFASSTFYYKNPTQ